MRRTIRIEQAVGGLVGQAEALEKKAQSEVADAALFLGQSLYEQGKYRQSAQIYEEASDRRPDDDAILNNLGLSWFLAGDYAKAEPLLRRALAIREQALSPDRVGIAQSLHSLTRLLEVKGDRAVAEPLSRRALAIREQELGPEPPRCRGKFEQPRGIAARQRGKRCGGAAVTSCPEH